MPSDSHFSPFPPRSRLATWRPPLILAADAAIACVALWLAYQLRFDDPSPFTADLPVLALALCVVRMLVNYAFHLHFWSFKFSSLRDAARLGIAGVVGTLLFVAVSFFLLRNSLEALPARGVVVLEMLLSIAGMAALRFGPRLLFTYRADLMPRRRLGAARTLIAGAGSAGELLLRDLQRQDEARLHVVGFVDDNPAKWGQIVGGKPVLGGLDDLPRFIERHRVQRVVIAIRAIDPVRLRDVLTRDTPQPVRFQILPPGHGALDEQNAADALRDVAPQDLLVREVVTFDHAAAGDSLAAGPWLLVAGAAGSIGSEVCRQLLEVGARRLVLLDTDENGLYVLLRRFQRAFPDREILAEVADIRDRPRLDRLFARYRPRDVFHAAARKHVPLMEAAPCEAIKTNVLGTLHLAEVAEAYGVERFVYTSTDKAVRPTNVMGATKRLGEHLLRALDERSRTSFLSVRFGNVLDSAGSVVPLFREQIAA
ncbi:MAG: polysaccharide biosynthesis protein, partial [Acidobacteriota bacterium]